MIPFECINKACYNLLKYKDLQIYLENMTGESFWGNGWNISNTLNLSTMPANQISYSVTIRLRHNFHIDLVFHADDFDITKPWEIESDIKLGELSDEDKQIARFMYFFWKLNEYLSKPRADTGPLAEFIFSRTRTIRQEL